MTAERLSSSTSSRGVEKFYSHDSALLWSTDSHKREGGREGGVDWTTTRSEEESTCPPSESGEDLRRRRVGRRAKRGVELSWCAPTFQVGSPESPRHTSYRGTTLESVPPRLRTLLTPRHRLHTVPSVGTRPLVSEGPNPTSTWVPDVHEGGDRRYPDTPTYLRPGKSRGGYGSTHVGGWGWSTFVPFQEGLPLNSTES